MKGDNNKTKKELVEELTELRRRVTKLEASEVNREILERALEKSETKFRSLTERSVVGVYLIQGGFFRYVNPRLAEIFGYKPAEIIDKLSPWNLVCKEDRRRLEENLRKRISGEIEAINYQFRGLRKDESVIYIQAYGSRMEYEGASAIIGSLIDITERKIAEKAIKAEKKRFQSLCENVPFGVVMIGKDGAFEYKNPRFVELFGHESGCGGAVPGLDFDKTEPLRTRKPLAQWKSYMRGLGKGGAVPRTIAVHCRDGNEKIIHFRPVQLHKKAYLVTCEDITQRIEYEDALRKSERRYKTLVEEINDGYFVVQDQRITFANQAFCRMHGTSIDNVLGRSFLSFVSPECRRGLLDAYWGVLAGRPAEGHIQYSRIGALPEHSATEVKARAADLGEGPVLIGICRDISERVAMESKIREHERMA